MISDITISPAQLFIGVVHPGQKVTKKLVVRGKKPFKILEVKCADKSFEIEASKEAKAVHLVPVVFTAGNDPGRVSQKISLLTDQGENVVQAFTAYAEIVKLAAARHTATAEKRTSYVPFASSRSATLLPGRICQLPRVPPLAARRFAAAGIAPLPQAAALRRAIDCHATRPR